MGAWGRKRGRERKASRPRICEWSLMVDSDKESDRLIQTRSRDRSTKGAVDSTEHAFSTGKKDSIGNWTGSL